MHKIVLNIKDESKFSFIKELLSQFDFIEIDKPKIDKKKKNNHNIFDSAGIWKNRDINLESIRKKAWKMSNDII